MRLILYLVVGFFFYRVIEMIHMHYKHDRRMKKITELSDFHKKLIELADQIKDQKTKEIFIEHCIKLMSYDSSVKSIDKFDKEKEMQIIANKFGRHIPEMLQNHRQKQLEKLL